MTAVIGAVGPQDCGIVAPPLNNMKSPDVQCMDRDMVVMMPVFSEEDKSYPIHPMLCLLLYLTVVMETGQCFVQ